jgi:antitoxin component of MazEF toxin-antitoxin module
MVKKIIRIGNSHGIILDQALMDLAHLRPGDDLIVTVHEGGSIRLDLSRPVVEREDAAKSARAWISANDTLFRRLS